MAQVYDSTSFRDNNFLSIPPDVWKQVSEDGLRGKIAFWHVYSDEGDLVILLADDKIQRDEFTFAESSEYYDEKESGDRDIRPPKDVQRLLKLDDKNPVVFLVGYSDLFREDLNAVFLLRAHQLAELLPSAEYVLEALPVTPKKMGDAAGGGLVGGDDDDTSVSENTKIRRALEGAFYADDELERFSVDVTVPGESALRSA